MNTIKHLWFKIGLIQTPRCWFIFWSKGRQFIAARKFWHQIEDQQDAENYWLAPQWKTWFKRQHMRYTWNRLICWSNRRAACKKQMWRNTFYIYIYSMKIILAESVKKDSHIYHLIMYIFDIFIARKLWRNTLISCSPAFFSTTISRSSCTTFSFTWWTRSSKDEYSTNVQSFITNQQIILVSRLLC